MVPRLVFCVCNHPYHKYTATVLITGSRCPLSWVEYTDQCYTATRLAQGVPWVEADRLCNEDGAHLVSIMDEDEMQVVHHLIMTMLGSSESETYIGKMLNVLVQSCTV